MVAEHRHRVQVVDRDVEEPLHLRRVRADAGYGALSHRQVDQMDQGEGVEGEVFSLRLRLGGASAVGDEDDLLDVVARLLDKSMVTASPNGRLRLLRTVREYASELLAGDQEAVRGRHGLVDLAGLAVAGAVLGGVLLEGGGLRKATARNAAGCSRMKLFP